MQDTARRPKITVSADGKGLVFQAGGLLLAETPGCRTWPAGRKACG